MRNILVAVGISAISLMASCASQYQNHVAYSVTFAIPDGTVFPGTVTPNGTMRTIALTRPDGVSCQTIYRAGTKVVPISCADGKNVLMTGSTTMARDYATIRLPDNRVAQFTGNVSQAYSPPEYSSLPSSNYCRNSNYYGAISCATGLPKTQHVNGYYRKDGTYVKPYYRSRRS